MVRRRQTPTIYAVAERAGVSIATVSRVLQGSGNTSAAARDRVHQAVRQLDYRPQSAAQTLAGRSYQAHGLVIGDLAGPYYTDLVLGLESSAARSGQSIVVQVADDSHDTEEALRHLAGRVDGLVIASTAVPDELAADLAGRLPVLLVGRGPVTGCDALTTANRPSAYALTRHLLDHGRTALRFVGDPTGSHDVRERHLGFSQALREAGLRSAPVIAVPLTVDSGRPVAGRTLARIRAGEIDALVCANDELALATAHELRQVGVRVGVDVAITGWDDVMAARFVTPGLTTVTQPVRQLGELAGTVLQQRIDGSSVPNAWVLPTTVVHRGSCGCPDGPSPTSTESTGPRDEGV